MRIQFQLKGFEPMSFSVQGKTYSYAEVNRLGARMNVEANMEESIVQTPDGKKVWLTVVGDDEESNPYGIMRGWYVATVLDDKSAALLAQALRPWSER